MRRFVIVWLCGVMFALIMQERWRRIGAAAVAPAALDPAPAADTPAAKASVKERLSRTGRAVGHGARSDFQRVRELPAKVRRHQAEPANETAEVIDVVVTTPEV